ncbi:hypothetical protein [Ralstonia mannitolilytica]|uniref:hypothetical protein n=1 Tax=Ralstonia mannitolilytica TaxID=105219 RepID=UPI0021555A0B|nr:hypothetical protein [Ralstonia mannitolilytica]
MKTTTCLQYVINGMGQKLLDFAKSDAGRPLVYAFKNLMVGRDNQIKALISASNSYYMVQAVIQIQGLPKTPHSVFDFMKSSEFDKLDQEIVNTVEKNFAMLMSRLTKQQRKELEALFS